MEKEKFLLGDRLVLFKFVHSSLPIYFLSFFKTLSGIISSIEFIFKCFFGVGMRILGKYR